MEKLCIGEVSSRKESTSSSVSVGTGLACIKWIDFIVSRRLAVDFSSNPHFVLSRRTTCSGPF